MDDGSTHYKISSQDVARTGDMLTMQQADEILERLAWYFEIPKPRLSWTNKARNGRANILYNKVSLGPKCWRGGTNSLLHEFAHILQGRRLMRIHRVAESISGQPIRTVKLGHGQDFKKALFDTVQYWFYGDQMRYGWLSEYRSIARYARRIFSTEIQQIDSKTRNGE